MTDQEIRLQCVAMANHRAYDKGDVITLAQEIYGFVMNPPAQDAEQIFEPGFPKVVHGLGIEMLVKSQYEWNWAISRGWRPFP